MVSLLFQDSAVIPTVKKDVYTLMDNHFVMCWSLFIAGTCKEGYYSSAGIDSECNEVSGQQPNDRHTTEEMDSSILKVMLYIYVYI